MGKSAIFMERNNFEKKILKPLLDDNNGANIYHCHVYYYHFSIH